jgi:predicted alpha/beta hydrolase
MDPQHLEVRLVDGFRLSATVYQKSNTTRDGNRVVLINSATAVKRAFYEPYACFLAEQGYTVVTFDYRGIGDSRPASLRGFEARLRDWGELDIAGMIDWITAEFKPSRLFVVAHSIGGQLVALAGNNSLISAMVTVAAQHGYWKLYDSPKRYQQYVSARFLVPTLTAICGYLPMKFFRHGEDMPVDVALEWANWCLNPNYMFGDETLRSRDNIKLLRAPLLSISIEDDRWATERAVDCLMQFYSGAKISRRHVRLSEVGADSIGHFGFFKAARLPTLWRDTSEWLGQQ